MSLSIKPPPTKAATVIAISITAAMTLPSALYPLDNAGYRVGYRCDFLWYESVGAFFRRVMRDLEGPIALDSFEVFFKEAEPRLHDALSACLGSELGREAAVDALAFGWENWEKVGVMANPIGYLYVVGRDRGRRSRRRRRVVVPLVEESRLPWVEPGLVGALAGLPERQRVVVTLVYGFEWTLSETADLLGLKKTTVQNHAERGLSKLRSSLGVGV